MFSFGHCPNEGGGRPLPELFLHFFINCIFGLFLHKCMFLNSELLFRLNIYVPSPHPTFLQTFPFCEPSPSINRGTMKCKFSHQQRGAGRCGISDISNSCQLVQPNVATLKGRLYCSVRSCKYCPWPRRPAVH